MAKKILLRKGTASQWTYSNPILSQGEIGFEVDTYSFKIGDGTNYWTHLEYFTPVDLTGYATESYVSTAAATASAAAVTHIIDSAPTALDTLNELAAALGDDANFASTVTTSLAAKADKDLSIVEATSASTTLILSYSSKMVKINNGSANSLIVPPNSSVAFPVGTQISLVQTGAGQTTISGGSGVTVNSSSGLKFRAQWSSVTLVKIDTNVWVAIGDLTT